MKQKQLNSETINYQLERNVSYNVLRELGPGSHEYVFHGWFRNYQESKR